MFNPLYKCSIRLNKTHMESTFRFAVQLFAFLISNKLNDLSALPPRAKSTLQPMVAEFNPYTQEEAEEILAERIEKAFQPRTVSRKILRRVAEAASKAGDIRVGFSVLLTAGYLAERDRRGKISLDDLETAAKAAEIIL